MARRSPRSDRSRSRLRRSAVRRLDRAAGRANPFLMLIAIGLAIIDLSCFTALKLCRVPVIAAPDQTAAAPPPPARDR